MKKKSSKLVTSIKNLFSQRRDGEPAKGFPIGLMTYGVIIFIILYEIWSFRSDPIDIPATVTIWHIGSVATSLLFKILMALIVIIFILVAIFSPKKKKKGDDSKKPVPATEAAKTVTTTTVIKKTPLWVSMIGYGLGFIFIGGALYVFFYLALAIRTEGWHFIESVPYPTETTVIDNYPSFETLHYGRHYLAKKGRYKFLMAGSSQQSTLPEYYFTPEDRGTTTFHYFKLGYEDKVFWSYKVTRTDADSVTYEILENHNDGSGGWIKIKPDHDGYVMISEGPNPH